MRTPTTVRGAAQVFAVLVGTAVILLPGGPLGPLPAAAAAQVVTACPGPGNPITVDTELGANLVAGPADNPCVAFGADTIRLRLRGFAIDMRNVLGATTIAASSRNNVSVIGDDGFVLTSGGVGISVNNGSNVEIREVRVRNNVPAGSPSTTPCVAITGTDRGIRLQGVIGARVIENLVECYGIGVDVSNSTGGGNKENLIGRNIIQNNAAVNCPLPETEIVCTAAGLSLSSSSGWLVFRTPFLAMAVRSVSRLRGSSSPAAPPPPTRSYAMWSTTTPAGRSTSPRPVQPATCSSETTRRATARSSRRTWRTTTLPS